MSVRGGDVAQGAWEVRAFGRVEVSESEFEDEMGVGTVCDMGDGRWEALCSMATLALRVFVALWAAVHGWRDPYDLDACKDLDNGVTRCPMVEGGSALACAFSVHSDTLPSPRRRHSLLQEH